MASTRIKKVLSRAFYWYTPLISLIDFFKKFWYNNYEKWKEKKENGRKENNKQRTIFKT